MHSSKLGKHDADAEIARLKVELFMTRRAMISLMREDAQAILLSSSACQSLADVVDWSERAARDVLALCQPQPAEVMGGIHKSSPRTTCPLCMGDNSGPGDVKGFAFPEGMTRHLLGTYKARQCPVFKIAVEQARAELDMVL
jgi:hypothetical protein